MEKKKAKLRVRRVYDVEAEIEDSIIRGGVFGPHGTPAFLAGNALYVRVLESTVPKSIEELPELQFVDGPDKLCDEYGLPDILTIDDISYRLEKKIERRKNVYSEEQVRNQISAELEAFNTREQEMREHYEVQIKELKKEVERYKQGAEDMFNELVALKDEMEEEKREKEERIRQLEKVHEEYNGVEVLEIGEDQEMKEVPIDKIVDEVLEIRTKRIRKELDEAKEKIAEYEKKQTGYEAEIAKLKREKESADLMIQNLNDKIMQMQTPVAGAEDDDDTLKIAKDGESKEYPEIPTVPIAEDPWEGVSDVAPEVLEAPKTQNKDERASYDPDLEEAFEYRIANIYMRHRKINGAAKGEKQNEQQNLTQRMFAAVERDVEAIINGDAARNGKYYDEEDAEIVTERFNKYLEEKTGKKPTHISDFTPYIELFINEHVRRFFARALYELKGTERYNLMNKIEQAHRRYMSRRG